MFTLRAFSLVAITAILLGGFLSYSPQVAAARSQTQDITQTYSCEFPNGTFTIDIRIRYSADQEPYVFDPECGTSNDDSWTDNIFVQVNCDYWGADEDFISAQIWRVDPSYVRNATLHVRADCRRTTGDYDSRDGYVHHEALNFGVFRSQGRVSASFSTSRVR